MKTAMKKILAIFVVLAVCLSAASCFKKKSAAVNDPASEQEQSAVTSAASEASDGYDESAANEESPEDEQDAQNPVGTVTTGAKSSGSTKNNNTPETTSSTESITVNVTIPYGYSLSQIGDALQAKGVCSKSDFLSTVNSYDFSYYDLVQGIPVNDHRCYKLEGYLYPDTYTFYKNSKPQDVIGKMIRGAENNIGSKYSYSGMSTYQIITLASIIQKEVNNAADMKGVSMVFHNRIKTGNMCLDADPTINYIEKYVKPNISGDRDRYNLYYNTYKCIGLPAGPICSPGANALNAAANPDTNYADYYYFFADKSGNTVYSKTLEEHNQKYQDIYGTTDSNQQ